LILIRQIIIQWEAEEGIRKMLGIRELPPIVLISKIFGAMER
jgi:hypothetical protein